LLNLIVVALGEWRNRRSHRFRCKGIIVGISEGCAKSAQSAVSLSELRFEALPAKDLTEPFFGSQWNRNHKSLTMSGSDGHLVRKAFLTKYGYSPELTYDEILREFRKRYDRAQALRNENAGLHRIMLIIEGMAEDAAEEDVAREREIRRLKIECLTEESGYGAAELDLLVEGFAARLEVEWIQRM
jgi:hypothetical protein